eukprot:5667589-Pyramimonas_sp.AAC.1
MWELVAEHQQPRVKPRRAGPIIFHLFPIIYELITKFECHVAGREVEVCGLRAQEHGSHVLPLVRSIALRRRKDAKKAQREGLDFAHDALLPSSQPTDNQGNNEQPG